MSKNLWSKDFLTEEERKSYSWVNKLFKSELRVYGINSKILTDNSGRLVMTYSFYIKRKYLNSLNEVLIQHKSSSIEKELEDVGVTLSPAVTDIEFSSFTNTISVVVTIPTLPYMSVENNSKSVVKYRQLIEKKLSKVNRDIVYQCALDKDYKVTYSLTL